MQGSLPKYEHFRFECGQFVANAFSEVNARARGVFQILERQYSECPGGIQIFYVCRPQSAFAPDQQLVRFNEIELVEYTKVEP